MHRRSGQNGSIERRGNFYYARYWIDVVGQEKRRLACTRICPVSGPGLLSKSERKRRAKEIIRESGADSVELFNKVQAINLGTTFKQQSETWLHHMRNRKRKPIKPATAAGFASYLSKWLNPSIGDVPLADVTNATLRDVVSKMADAGRSPKTIHSCIQAAQMIVESALDANGEPLYPRKWNHDFMDLPRIENQARPSFTTEQITAILAASSGLYLVLYALLAGSGMRIGEALGLEVRHLSADCTTITVEQSSWNGAVQSPKTKNAFRQIDLAPSLADLLKQHIGNRTSGFVFEGRDGKPIQSQSSILKRLHPILKTAGYAVCGFHAFRRFRVTWLRKQRTPEDLIRFWLGHANQSITDGYSRLSEDVEFRRELTAKVGLGFELPIQTQQIDTNVYETQLEVAVP